MKKIIAIVVVSLLLFASMAHGIDEKTACMMKKKTTGGPTCENIISSTDQVTVYDNYGTLGSASGYEYASFTYVISESVFSGIDIQIWRVGCTSCGYYICGYLYADSGGTPTGSSLTSLTPIAVSGLTTGLGTWEKLAASCQSRNGTYQLVLKLATDNTCATAVNDGSNFARFAVSTAGSGNLNRSANGSSWTAVSTKDGLYRGYK